MVPVAHNSGNLFLDLVVWAEVQRMPVEESEVLVVLVPMGPEVGVVAVASRVVEVETAARALSSLAASKGSHHARSIPSSYCAWP